MPQFSRSFLKNRSVDHLSLYKPQENGVKKMDRYFFPLSLRERGRGERERGGKNSFWENIP
jgi:hypothetical protein